MPEADRFSKTLNADARLTVYMAAARTDWTAMLQVKFRARLTVNNC
jgi:hypothetical protein